MPEATSDRALVASLAITTTAGYGVLFYAYGVLLVPMQRDLGWSRAYLSGAFSAGLVVAALVAIPIGRWLDRHDPRPLFLAGSAAALALTLGWAGARSHLTFAMVWLLLGVCQAILFYEPAFTVLTKHFHGMSRNRAITTVTLVAGLASTIFGPLTAFLEHHYGWRTTVVLLAALLGSATLPVFARGLRATVRDPVREDAPASAAPRATLRTRPFWFLTVAYLLSAVTTYGVAVHLVPFLLSRGLSSGTAASALGAVGFVQVLGRSTFLRLSVRHASVHLATWVLAVKAIGLALLLIVPGATGVVVFVIVYGSANGVSTLTRATTIGELYGPEHYGAISAVIASVSAFAGALAPFAVATAIDITGSQTLVFAALVALSLLGAAANEAVGRPTRRANRHAVIAADPGL